MTPADGGAAGDVVEMARRIARVAEMSAGIMRDRRRTGGWAGAEKTAQAFDRLSRDAYALHNALALRADVDAIGGAK